MEDLAIYGAGGLGREIAVLIEQINAKSPRWNFIGFFDDNPSDQTKSTLPILGGLNSLNTYDSKLNLVLAIAHSEVRSRLVNDIKNSNVSYPVIVHPNVNLGSSNNNFGRGCIIADGCKFTVSINFGEFVICNLNSTIGHDVVVGSFSSIMPGVHLSGNVKVGTHCLLGTGAVVLQNLSVGMGARVGAGAVVTKDVASKTTVVGVPAKSLS